MSQSELRALYTKYFNAFNARHYLETSRLEINRLQGQIDIVLVSRQQVTDPDLIFNFNVLIAQLRGQIATLNQQRDRATRTLYQLRAAPKSLCPTCRRNH